MKNTTEEEKFEFVVEHIINTEVSKFESKAKELYLDRIEIEKYSEYYKLGIKAGITSTLKRFSSKQLVLFFESNYFQIKNENT